MPIALGFRRYLGQGCCAKIEGWCAVAAAAYVGGDL